MSGLKHPKPLHFSGGSEAASVTQSSGGARKQLPRCRPRTPSLLPAGRHITKAFGSGCRALAVHSWNELSLAAGGALLRLPFLLPALTGLPVRRWDQRPWPVRLAARCSGGAGRVWCPLPVVCALHGFWETWALVPVSKCSGIPVQIHVLFEYCFQKNTRGR